MGSFEMLLPRLTLEAIKAWKGRGEILPLVQVNEEDVVSEQTHVVSESGMSDGFMLVGSAPTSPRNESSLAVYKYDKAGEETQWLIERRLVNPKPENWYNAELYIFNSSPPPQAIAAVHSSKLGVEFKEGEMGFIGHYYID